MVFCGDALEVFGGQRRACASSSSNSVQEAARLRNGHVTRSFASTAVNLEHSQLS